MKTIRKFVLPVILVAALLLTSCGGSAAESAKATATARAAAGNPTAMPTEPITVPTDAPQATATLQPTPTLNSTPTSQGLTPIEMGATQTAQAGSNPQPSSTLEPAIPTPGANLMATEVTKLVLTKVAELQQAQVPAIVGPTPNGGYPGVIQRPDGNNQWVIAIGPLLLNAKCQKAQGDVDERGGCDPEAFKKYREMYEGKAGGPGIAWVADFTQAQALLAGNPLLRVLFSERCNLDKVDEMRPGECLVLLEDLPLLNASLGLPEYDGTIVFTWDALDCNYNRWPTSKQYLNTCKHPSPTPAATATPQQ